VNPDLERATISGRTPARNTEVTGHLVPLHPRHVDLFPFLSTATEIFPAPSVPRIPCCTQSKINDLSMAAARRNILVVGATGKQGGATVRALLAPGSPPDFHVWALTRNTASPIAKKIADYAVERKAADRVHLIQGNLEDAAGIRKVFETIAAEGGVWGIFVAIAFPGLGVKDDREKDQGIVRPSRVTLVR